jgi:hypothetical protein
MACLVMQILSNQLEIFILMLLKNGLMEFCEKLMKVRLFFLYFFTENNDGCVNSSSKFWTLHSAPHILSPYKPMTSIEIWFTKTDITQSVSHRDSVYLCHSTRQESFF